MEYNCSRCGRTFCVNHRLPESHDCPGLELQKAQRADRRADGEEVPRPLDASNLRVTDLDLEDDRRQERLEGGSE